VVSLTFALLGPLEVRRDGEVVPVVRGRQRALLTMLLLRANETVSADRLIEQLWGDTVPADATNALQVHVSRLRRALGAGALITRAAGYQLRVEPGALDAEIFEAGAEDGRRALAAGRPLEAADTLRQALGLWRGSAIADCEYHSFAQADIARLEELRLAAHEELMDAELALGRCPVAELERLVREHPLRERLRGQLMLALHRSGRQADALAAYRRGRETLIAELGLEPSPALRSLEQDILQHAPALIPAAPVASPHESALVGRDEERKALRAALHARRPRVVLLSGAAGIGKTRLVAEAAAEARTAGATVLYGHADEGHPVPFGALVTALRGLPLDALAEFEPEQATLASVMPELRGRLTAGEGPELCLALSTVIGELARRGPLLLVLDDLHWADHDTLLLLRHLARSAPLAILGAFRDDEPDAGLAGLIAELHAERVLSHVPVRGLDLAATRALVGADAPELVDVLWEATGGNPFLIEELLRHRRADRLWVPESVHALLERRLVRLDGAARDVLATAAVIGAEFRLAHLEAVVGDDDVVLGALEQALAVRLVEEVDEDATRYRFSPPLLRDALRTRTGGARRVRVQRRIAALQRRAA
jgi:DNA-binding SARP family transcriptional activator